MEIKNNYDLSNLNTFGIKASSRFFVEINHEDDIKELFSSEIFKKNEKLFLGGGSNVLFTKDFEGILILNKLKGIEILEDNEDFVLIKSMGGESWHDLVLFTINNGYWGLENLSSIPGSVGATPVQNIGAYGVEVKDTLENVEAYSIENVDPSILGARKRIFTNKECEFGYRESVFKNKFKGQYFISAVTFKLSKKEKSNIRYQALSDYLEKNNIIVKSVKDISNAVTKIRESKLPDPKVLGNAGSFFKNVFVDFETLKKIKEKYPDVPSFEEDGMVKIPSGWLIESCGWKGKKIGNVGVHDKQALVLVNYGGAKGHELKDLSDQIISSVFSKFGITLNREVNLIS
jgi:UDP-N-acetylmuramate dehydrogenase